MPNWKLTLAYNGTGFHGWQIQPNLPTVQGTLADALHQITGESVLPQGAGRTDTGVHALAQVASFSLASPIPPQNLYRALNRILPPGIRVLSVEIAPPTFHARHSASGKRYEYRIFERRPQNAKPHERVCSPFLAPFVWDCRWPLHLDSMQTGAKHLLGTQDFTSFAATTRPRCPEDKDDDGPDSSTQPNPVKTIHTVTFHRDDNLLLFRIEGSGFLHHMVRNLVGTLVDIGRGSLTPDDLPRILASRDRSQAGPTAPATGLFLTEVLYPTDPASSHQSDILQRDPEEVTR